MTNVASCPDSTSPRAALGPLPSEHPNRAAGVRDRMAMRLGPHERRVLELRFGLAGDGPLTLSEVGDRLGVTREWVRKIEQRAITKLM